MSTRFSREIPFSVETSTRGTAETIEHDKAESRWPEARQYRIADFLKDIGHGGRDILYIIQITKIIMEHKTMAKYGKIRPFRFR